MTASEDHAHDRRGESARERLPRAALGVEADPDRGVGHSGTDTHGTVTLEAAKVTYTPDAGFVGTALFDYSVSDDGVTDDPADPRGALGR